MLFMRADSRGPAAAASASATLRFGFLRLCGLVILLPRPPQVPMPLAPAVNPVHLHARTLLPRLA